MQDHNHNPNSFLPNPNALKFGQDSEAAKEFLAAFSGPKQTPDGKFKIGDMVKNIEKDDTLWRIERIGHAINAGKVYCGRPDTKKVRGKKELKRVWIEEWINESEIELVRRPESKSNQSF